MGLAQSLAMTAQAVQMPDGFSETEKQLVSALAFEHSVSKIAIDLHYSERTIRRKLQTLYIKLGVATRSEVIHRCQKITNAEQTNKIET